MAAGEPCCLSTYTGDTKPKMVRIPEITVKQRNNARLDQPELVKHNDGALSVAPKYRTHIGPLVQRKRTSTKISPLQKEETLKN